MTNHTDVPSPQTVKVVFRDEIVDDIPCVAFELEIEEEARDLAEPTPAMYFALYLTHQFSNGSLMLEVEKFIGRGQFISTADKDGGSDGIDTSE